MVLHIRVGEVPGGNATTLWDSPVTSWPDKEHRHGACERSGHSTDNAVRTASWSSDTDAATCYPTGLMRRKTTIAMPSSPICDVLNCDLSTTKVRTTGSAE